MTTNVDVIVVHFLGVGSCAVYHLACSEFKVLCFETGHTCARECKQDASGPVGVTTQTEDVHCGSFLFFFVHCFVWRDLQLQCMSLFHPNCMAERGTRSSQEKRVNTWMFVEQADETQSMSVIQFCKP